MAERKKREEAELNQREIERKGRLFICGLFMSFT